MYRWQNHFLVSFFIHSTQNRPSWKQDSELGEQHSCSYESSDYFLYLFPVFVFLEEVKNSILYSGVKKLFRDQNEFKWRSIMRIVIYELN